MATVTGTADEGLHEITWAQKRETEQPQTLGKMRPASAHWLS
jgi:hypothetical protein